eukprot:CAMPEP_0206147976 /NCGR_PEP_ID=MMETSP1473-20131121/35203_1 /ASSEMBLY_ACC=CAM_ASM_001109 /TAXON_ID=1461547 /ORGANISM="Stichococcus sp, Strain RCC1054" /LENGTH=279 /DNA_ID=CAMNT_0053545151 /DNA_START=332 /DNA_END=1167 /DNA_ORIENTATION=+
MAAVEVDQQPLVLGLNQPGHWPASQGRPELNLLSEVVLQKGHVVDHHGACGLAQGHEGALTLLPAPAQGWQTEEAETVRQAIWRQLREVQQLQVRRHRASRFYDCPLLASDAAPTPWGPSGQVDAREMDDAERHAWLQGMRSGQLPADLVGTVPSGLTKRAMLEAFMQYSMPMQRALHCVRALYHSRARNGGDSKSREWTLHLVELMSSSLADGVRNAGLAMPSLATSPQTSTQASVQDHCGWIQIDLVPLFGSAGAATWSYLVAMAAASLAEGLLDCG